MVDINISVNVPAIDKLLDYTASGVGAIAGAMLAPWRASREGKARLISARADADVRLVEADSQAKTSLIIAEARSEARQYLVEQGDEVRGSVEITCDDIVQHIDFQERKRIANIKSVVESAADALGEKEVVDHEPDTDWTARFFDCVQDVSSEDMQGIWAKLLAGEVESPGRTSLRTLDTLRNMTKRDAEMFRDVCDFVLDYDFVVYNDSGKNIDSLNYGALLHLQDCGLINVGPDLGKHFSWESNEKIPLNYHNGLLMVTKDVDTKEILEVPVVLLTTAGRELFRFAECTPQMDYLRAFSKFLKSEGCRLEYIPSVLHSADGKIRYSACIPIEPESEEIKVPAE